jgi:hypothetical protein
MTSVRLNLDPLKDLQTALQGLEAGRAQVGIFADKAERRPDSSREPIDNPSLGEEHEFGVGNIPQRSFLEMPLRLYLVDEIHRSRAGFGQLLATSLTEADGVTKLLARLGKAAEAVVDLAFSSGGFGHWPKLHKETLLAKAPETRILIETTQLWESVSSRVV